MKTHIIPFSGFRGKITDAYANETTTFITSMAAIPIWLVGYLKNGRNSDIRKRFI